ncbi:hypothetical protein NUITMVRE34_30450 [Enterococcus gallinarum]|nr:hypothetical protein NUITMVRE34_30450 [Enterococcus gallinarum]GMS52909.1 hypothetical protein NUITMVRE35_30450 [Enterococcus gallinarum]
MITSRHNRDGDIMMNRKKSAEVIVVTKLTGYEGLNNNNLEKFRRCEKCDNRGKQSSLTIVKRIVWNTKDMTKCVALLAVNK